MDIIKINDWKLKKGEYLNFLTIAINIGKYTGLGFYIKNIQIIDIHVDLGFIDISDISCLIAVVLFGFGIRLVFRKRKNNNNVKQTV